MLSETQTINDAISNEENDHKQHLIDDDKFLLIKNYQQKIRKITEFSPTIRKLINQLITEDNLEKLTAEYIHFLNQFNIK